MSFLTDYLKKNAAMCQPGEGDADMIFFGVKRGEEATAGSLREAISVQKGVHCDINLFDGQEHSYLEVGGWIGDQGDALLLMGLGAALGLWKLLTPKTVLGQDIPDDLVQQMAGMGMVTIQA